MSKGESIITWISKFTPVRDELDKVGNIVVDSGLVSLSLLGLHNSWESFQDAVSGKENIPN